MECEDTLHIAAQAYPAEAGGELPALASGIEYPELDPEWDFSFDDDAEMAGRLPRLAALFLDC